MISKNLILGLAVATVMTAAIDITSTTKDNKWSNDNLRNTSMNTFKGTHLGNIEDSYPGWVTGNKPTLELEIFFDFNSEDIGLLRDNTRHFVNLAVQRFEAVKQSYVDDINNIFTIELTPLSNELDPLQSKVAEVLPYLLELCMNESQSCVLDEYLS